ncbi:glycosyltransferase [Fusobacterium sp.]|uniref:glycosyltransferase n=1 Tax=Fusobacterium sp. TaxID=68766 RepID=UPI000C709CD2|nr:glycosyltransferase [Fusobacterium sp.]
MEKIKVLFYNGQLFMGGIERVAVSYITELSKDKDIELFVVIKENDMERNVFLKYLPKNINVQFIKTEEMVSLREKVSKKRKNIFWKIVYLFLINYERIYMKHWLKKFNDKNTFDLIIDFDMSLGKYIQLLDGIKLGWVHFSLKFKKQNKNKSIRFEKRLKKYNKIITICDEMKEEALNLYGLSNEKVERLYNPFDFENIKKQSENISLTAEEQNLLNNKYMVAVSRLVKQKGREDLIDIYSILKNKYKIKEKLYILGDGPEKEALSKKIKELDLETDIFLIGQKDNPFIWMKNAEVFLHTSYGEGLPTVFLESMILGTPVISYDCPTGPKDILSNNEYGYLVETGNKQKFAFIVKTFLDNKEEGQLKLNKFYKEKLQEFYSKSIIEKVKKMR